MDYRSSKDLSKAARELIEAFQSRWQKMGLQTDFDRLQSLRERSKSPEFWSDTDKAQEATKQINSIEKKLAPWLEIRQEILDFPDLIELTLEESNTEETVNSLNTDFNVLDGKFHNLEILGALSGSEDYNNAFFNIHPGAGGTESQDWAEMLFRMYSRYFENKGYKVDLIDFQEGEGAGLKNVTMHVQGEYAYGYLKGENGVHRLVRISPFDANKRRHTSFVSVHVEPELDDSINVVIEDKDLKVDTYRSSGAGGQHVNKTDSAVRMTHIPTGIVVQCQNERSQIKNRATAMKMLKAKLYDLEKKKNEEEQAKKSGEKKDIAWGSQIRSYVFHPYNLIKDHRTEHETANISPVMDGDLEPFILAYLKTQML
ncbi:MAG TPA: peptide chain release factor 2 [Leptospiraceae bacterium]|nr:peptide chain release factor 2 [Leptospiraceae bacterium]HMZ58488.1 peptide chain release factor 2 [Leptospiraceae bacterium]HNF16793.1 peptide chain release factor 2 [Leptospiraceae bacterium]HNM05497.1 peptide chain release factor 2 [Leptospiraceae bacterium]HNN06741.1 peptide chain release factor 2 [Leptospiraceae bacterium]